jgi:Na+/proline symporter
MLQGWVVVVIALAYIGFLFLVASYGDRRHQLTRGSRARLLIYPLSLAIYCTSWTFFGSVGVAARTGFEFLTIYIGPVLMVGLAYPLIIRIIRLAKGQNITSIADFIAARYGKSQAVAATVALIAIVGMIPYIALQLKAVSASVGTILAAVSAGSGAAEPLLGDIALFVALLMAAFAVLFGTRHIDATEHQDGLMLAVATESVIKLVAFLAVGIFVTFVMYPGPLALFADALQRPETAAVLTRVPPATTFLASTVLSLFAIVLLPRQFHVGVVENHSEAEVRRAAWLFPLYLVLINLFVMPIAMAGLLTFPAGGTDGDMFVLALPLKAHSELFALIAFVGGLSAATAMVIVESVALAIMVSNDIVMPLVLKRRAAGSGGPSNAGAQLLTVRRIAIFAILFLAYIYYRSAGPAQLASIGLLSFAAITQLMPAFFGGLVWRRGTAPGAIAGMTAGILVWAYTLLLPSISDVGVIGDILNSGPLGLVWLRPQALFGLDLPPLVHGVVLSLLANVILYVSCSLARRPTAIERVQADVFVPSSLAPMAPSFRLRRSSVTTEELIATIARYLGEERTRESFASFAASRRVSLAPQAEADFQLLQYGEYLLASAIGAASSRLVLSLLLRKRTVSTKAALKLLDDANAAIHYNREILQTALDHVRQGIAVFDKDLALVCWNRQFGEIFDLPHSLTRIGIALDEILRHIAKHDARDARDLDDQVAQRLARYTSEAEPFLERIADRGLVIEVRADRMPDGGVVTTFTDITPSFMAG